MKQRIVGVLFAWTEEYFAAVRPVIGDNGDLVIEIIVCLRKVRGSTFTPNSKNLTTIGSAKFTQLTRSTEESIIYWIHGLTSDAELVRKVIRLISFLVKEANLCKMVI